MDNTEEMVTMLNHISNPAFFAVDGIITATNEAAAQRQLCVGTDVRSLLVTGQEEFAQFQQGTLFLTLQVCDIPSCVSVTRLDNDRMLFELEQDADQAELQHMALVAKTLRIPLADVMTVTSQLFPFSSGDSDPALQAKLAKLNKGLYQITRVVCNMSDAYRYSNSAPRTEIREIGSLMKEFFSKGGALIEQSGISLHYTGLSTPVYTLIDSEMLERAVGNILSNAVKFSQKGGTVHAQLVQRKKMLYLTVQDDGTGVPSNQKVSTYSRYRRQPGLEDSRFGVGIGMVLIRQAAAAHGGTVLLEHGSGYGLRLTMTLPIRQPSDPNVRSPMIHVDYAGELDHWLLELADCLPAELYSNDALN